MNGSVEMRVKNVNFTCREIKFPLNYLKRQITISRSKTDEKLILCRMIPLKLAEARTIHTSQGTTEQEIAVHRPETLFLKLFYVACSRVVSLHGLYFTDVRKKFDIKKLQYKSNDPNRKKM